jgi:hypothetical protein
MTRIFLCFFLLTTVCMTIDAYADENANYEFQILYDLVDADLQYGLEHALDENPKWRD